MEEYIRLKFFEECEEVLPHAPNQNSLTLLPQCIEVLERYQRLLDEFHGPNGSINYDVTLKKINDCLQGVEDLILIDDGSFLSSLSKLGRNLYAFLDFMNTRKMVDVSKNITTPLVNNTHRQENSKTITSVDTKKRVIKTVTITEPKVNGLNDVVGLWETKKILKTVLLLPRYQPQLFENRKICNRLLLFGPPGTGKTLLAHAVAAEIGAQFHSVTGSDILSSYVGESEKAVKSLFEDARKGETHSVVFLDEIDAFCRKRTSRESNHNRSINTEIMCQLNNIEESRNLFIIGATNCPWDLDTAIVRRFQKRIFVSLPDRIERLELLKFCTKNTPLSMLDMDDWVEILDKTEGLSSSDISTLVQNAMDIPLLELQDTILWKKTIDNFYEPANREDDALNVFLKKFDELPINSVRARSVGLSDLIEESKKYKRTVSSEDMEQYKKFNEK